MTTKQPAPRVALALGSGGARGYAHIGAVQELCSRMAIIDQGQVRYSGPPAEALHAIRGRVWEKAIDKQELEAVAAQHRLISHKLVAGRPIVHVLSDGTPGDGFKAAEPNLEDVFFSTLKGGITEHAPA